MNYIWVTGMFRSGTTLLAKMFDAHPAIAFASDPYRPFFNDLRDVIAKENGLLNNNPPHMPLSDYFCDDEQLQAMKLIQKSSLEEKISDAHLDDLKIRIRDRGMEFSPFVANKVVGTLKGNTYRKLFSSMMELVQQCYGKGDEETIGIKEVWCNEFTGVLLRAFSNMKAINIVRDPRAVFASRSVVGEKYPLIFLIRQWRKLAIFTWLFTNMDEFSNSLLVVKYEDLIKNPEEISRKICSFVDVDFSLNMIDGAKFRHGDGSTWLQNSSFGKGSEISTKYSEKWRSVLRQEEIRLIEMLCFHEMKLFGYKPLNDGVESISRGLVYNPLIIKEEELAGWIKPFVDTRIISNFVEMAKEMARSELVQIDKETLSKMDINDKIIESLFIRGEYFDHVRNSYLSRSRTTL